MARIGITAAAVIGSEPESWYRLNVFDDGWVEVPGAARGAARYRNDLRRLGLALGAIVSLFAVGMLVPHLGLDDRWGSILAMVTGLALVVVLLVTAATQLPRTFARMRDARADRAQMARERAQGDTVRLVPGAPKFTRATSAEQFASWLTPVHLVRAADIATLTLGTEGEDAIAWLTFADGTTRGYRSPDRRLADLLRKVAFAPGVLPSP